MGKNYLSFAFLFLDSWIVATATVQCRCTEKVALSKGIQLKGGLCVGEDPLVLFSFPNITAVQAVMRIAGEYTHMSDKNNIYGLPEIGQETYFKFWGVFKFSAFIIYWRLIWLNQKFYRDKSFWSESNVLRFPINTKRLCGVLWHYCQVNCGYLWW